MFLSPVGTIPHPGVIETHVGVEGKRANEIVAVTSEDHGLPVGGIVRHREAFPRRWTGLRKLLGPVGRGLREGLYCEKHQQQGPHASPAIPRTLLRSPA